MHWYFSCWFHISDNLERISSFTCLLFLFLFYKYCLLVSLSLLWSWDVLFCVKYKVKVTKGRWRNDTEREVVGTKMQFKGRELFLELCSTTGQQETSELYISVWLKGRRRRSLAWDIIFEMLITLILLLHIVYLYLNILAVEIMSLFINVS